jgi:CRISPR/Cas system-associated exonuclease Cas4 (RecB family)
VSEVLKEVAVDPGRLQSPSSILTYKQCPRKYFYRYIAKLPVSKSIHLVRGSIAHKVLEDVYALDLAHIPDETFLITMRFILQEMFRKQWEASKEELAELGMDPIDLQTYYDETRIMINNFFHYLAERMQQIPGVTPKEAFRLVTPDREVELHSKMHHVRGYADAIQREGDKLIIIDYKTSKKLEITDDYRLQLGIYCMIYEEMERAPDEVGVFFLKHGRELRVPVTRDMIDHARKEVAAIHLNTKSKDIKDYPKKTSALCKWSSGQCEFYETCFSKTLDQYDEAPAPLVRMGRKSF